MSPSPKNQKHQLRIISGKWRGRKLTIADAPGLRPTGDRIRETLFNWLMGDITDSHCLDLFAGTGALGFESLSRGAASATLLEFNPKVANTLKQHCKDLKAEEVQVIQSDALTWIQSSNNTHKFDIAFIDPPFAANLWDPIIEALATSNLLSKSALIYCETPRHQAVSWPANWEILKEKHSGDVTFRLLQTGA